MFTELNREDPGQAPVPAENMRRTLQMLRAQPARGRAVVLDGEGQCQGYALLISFWSNELGGECCSIDELYVTPRERSRGHATALFRELSERKLWEREAVALILEVARLNLRALALYRRLGFRGENLSLRLPLL